LSGSTVLSSHVKKCVSSHLLELVKEMQIKERQDVFMLGKYFNLGTARACTEMYRLDIPHLSKSAVVALHMVCYF
jgi:hypothetical protein